MVKIFPMLGKKCLICQEEIKKIESNRVIVKNLLSISTINDVRKLLEGFDFIKKIRLFGEKNKRNVVAIVYFNEVYQSLKAVKELNCSCFQGRFVYLAPYKKLQQKLNQIN